MKRVLEFYSSNRRRGSVPFLGFSLLANDIKIFVKKKKKKKMFMFALPTEQLMRFSIFVSTEVKMLKR